MKTRYHLLLVLFTLLSCTEDEEKADPTSDYLSYEGAFYDITDGMTVDFGVDGSHDNHYNYDFYLTDGDAYGDENSRTFVNFSYILYVELFSNGTNQFKTGEFTFISEEEATAENVAGKNWFSNIQWRTIEDGDVMLGANIENGSITISGEERNYSLAINLDFKDGTVLEGNYSDELLYSSYLQK